jgi:hypothetical protein
MWAGQNGMPSNRWPNRGKGPPLFIPSISWFTLAQNTSTNLESGHMEFKDVVSARAPFREASQPIVFHSPDSLSTNIPMKSLIALVAPSERSVLSKPASECHLTLPVVSIHFHSAIINSGSVCMNMSLGI